jgi:hypothetical protein
MGITSNMRLLGAGPCVIEADQDGMELDILIKTEVGKNALATSIGEGPCLAGPDIFAWDARLPPLAGAQDRLLAELRRRRQ